MPPRAPGPARCPLLLVPVLVLLLGAAGRGGEPARIGLWNGAAPTGAPGGEATEEADAFVTVHLPEGRAEGATTPAVVICPGGGYGGLVTGPEGHGIAAWLTAHGIAGVVLEYRLPHGRAFVPLADASRAIRTVRARAAEWHIDPGRVGIMGFSAGGHLASTAATHFDEGDPQGADEAARRSSRPDFAILVYPVITLLPGATAHGGSRSNLLGPSPSADLVRRFSAEQQVTADTTPTFLAHAEDDAPVPIANSVLFHDALVAKGVPVRLLRLPSGGHGLDGYKGPSWDAWQTGSLAWLRQRGMVP